MASQPIDETRNVAWQPDGCPPWCNDGVLHVDDDDYDDRSHTGGVVILPLLADDERPQHTDKPELYVHLQQHYREIEPRVHIGKNGAAAGVFLTLVEAERLAVALLQMVATAGSGGEQEEQDDVKCAFFAGHFAGREYGNVPVDEQWRSFARWRSNQ